MVTAAAYTAAVLVMLGCGTYAWSVLSGHHDGPGWPGCLRRTMAIRMLIIATLAAICAVHVSRAARHPARHARYLTARALRRIPGRPGDGEALDPGEARAFIAICRGWKDAARNERSRT
jgi:hypothetical protein